MKETHAIVWERASPKSIKLTWQGIPFNATASIKWRGNLIHIRIKAQKTDYGWERIITFLYNNHLFHCKLTKWKYTGGKHGDQPPNISTPENKLSIEMASNSLSLRDEPTDISSNMADIGEAPFEIIYTPDDVLFD